MMKYHHRIAFIFLLIEALSAQPDSRFDTFDWVMYRHTGEINSISEGFNYAYFGTEDAGILRFNHYQNRFDSPITTVQGISDNSVFAVHFDRETGMLWAATENSIEYSHNAKGNWFHVDLYTTGLHSNATIRQIGSSSSYIWLNAGSAYLKLDRMSGIPMGVMPNPDEENIIWSSGFLRYFEFPEKLRSYSIMDGWISNYSEFIDPYGRTVIPTTYFTGQSNVTYVGADDGTILVGDNQMETFYPYKFGLNNTAVTDFTIGNSFWIFGKNWSGDEGITRFYPRHQEFDYYDSDVEINLSPLSFYSIVETEQEVWLGGNGIISIYNKNKDYWREIGNAKGVPGYRITTMAEDTTSVWVGSTRGMSRILKKSKRSQKTDIEVFLRNRYINDIAVSGNFVWIATPLYLYIYDTTENIIYDFREFGDISNLDEREDIFTGFTTIKTHRNAVFIATALGIIQYNLKTDKWGLAVDPSAFGGQKLNAIALSGNHCFAGTDKGIWQIRLDDNSSRFYDFSFIGVVNEMYIRGNALWIGSDNGLIKYLWKKHI